MAASFKPTTPKKGTTRGGFKPIPKGSPGPGSGSYKPIPKGSPGPGSGSYKPIPKGSPGPMKRKGTTKGGYGPTTRPR